MFGWILLNVETEIFVIQLCLWIIPTEAAFIWIIPLTQLLFAQNAEDMTFSCQVSEAELQIWRFAHKMHNFKAWFVKCCHKFRFDFDTAA